tara:strand:- start:24 stop:197 length:174 start_codon:yes stop_codon:yes gene_type:complete
MVSLLACLWRPALEQTYTGAPVQEYRSRAGNVRSSFHTASAESEHPELVDRDDEIQF